MSIGMLLISVELLIMLFILLFIPGDYAGACFIGFAIGESLGAAALRIAGGIFTKIADIGSDLMKIVFNIKEDDARNPGVIADCTGDNAGDSVGPSADGFETYGVTGVALITFIMLAVPEAATQIQLLVWIFVMRVMMIIASGVFLPPQRGDREGALRQRVEDELRGAAHVARLADVDRLGSAHLRRVVSADLGPGRRDALVEAVDHHHLRHARRRHHSRAGQGLHVGGVEPREGSRDLVARRRPVAQHPVGLRRRQLQRLLDRPQHRRADDHRVLRQRHRHVDVDADAGARGIRIRPRRVRIPRHGSGDDCRRLLRSGHRQRAVGLRAVGDRGYSGHPAGAQEGLRDQRAVRARQGDARRERRRRQHVQGDRQAGADRHRRRRRDDDDLLDHRRADARS